MQIILQATHGVVSGAPNFFKRAFGDSYQDFENILSMPHRFIFNRDWYEKYDGKAELNEFKSVFKKLSESEKKELIVFLSNFKPSELAGAISNIKNKKINEISQFYIPIGMDEEEKIWKKQKQYKQENKINIEMTEEEIVEDAGLDEEIELTNKIK